MTVSAARVREALLSGYLSEAGSCGAGFGGNELAALDRRTVVDGDGAIGSLPVAQTDLGDRFAALFSSPNRPGTRP